MAKKTEAPFNATRPLTGGQETAPAAACTTLKTPATDSFYLVIVMRTSSKLA